jgi:hypothetical protein
MSRGVNKVILVGNLGADPETRSMPSGMTVTNIRIATSESWKDKTSGAQQEKTSRRRGSSPGEQRVGEAELGQVADAARIENAVQVIHLVLHHAGMKIADTVRSMGRPCGIEPV